MVNVQYFVVIQCYFGVDVLIVDNLDFDIVDGEFLVLVGLFGCGKFIMLCVLVGLEFIESGCISIGDVDVMYLLLWVCDVVMVFQNYVLYLNMMVVVNMGFVL